MKLYFSCSLTGGRSDEQTYVQMVEYLLARGDDVLTAHLAYPDVMRAERVVDPGEVFQRDIAWLDMCDAVVAEVSTPSHGVGYEIAYALELGKPVLCCYREGKPVSKMLLGNDKDGMQVQSYHAPQQALALIEAFLQLLDKE